MSSEKLSLRLVIDIKRNKVLYAEAGKDVVDFLFSILAMPVGTVVKLLNDNNKEGITSGISKLYQSIEQLDEKYLQPKQRKNLLLDPVILSRDKIKSFLLPELIVKDSVKSPLALPIFYGNGIVKVLTTYTIADDLTVTPMDTISSIVILNRLNIKDLEFLEEKNIDLSVEKGLELLKASLQSKTVLSDVFLGMDKI